MLIARAASMAGHQGPLPAAAYRQDTNPCRTQAKCSYPLVPARAVVAFGVHALPFHDAADAGGRHAQRFGDVVQRAVPTTSAMHRHRLRRVRSCGWREPLTLRSMGERLVELNAALIRNDFYGSYPPWSR